MTETTMEMNGMNIISDNRDWQVQIIKDHKGCDFVSYPSNYCACNHPQAHYPGETECNKDICPIRR